MSSYNNFQNQLQKYIYSLSKVNPRTYQVYQKMKYPSRQPPKEQTKTLTNKSLCSTDVTTLREEKPKKFSYTQFIELRNHYNYPFDTTEKRFEWQNLSKKNSLYYMHENNNKKHKHNPNYLKDNFGPGVQGIYYMNEQDKNKKNKIKRKKRFFNESFDFSKRVTNPEYNKEPERNNRKRQSELSTMQFHRTTGNIQSLMNLTPNDFPITKSKKLFRDKSVFIKSINLFDKNYGIFERPSSTKKLFDNNICYFDHINDEALLNGMKRKSRIKRSKSALPFTTSSELAKINVCLDILQLRNNTRGGAFPTRNKNRIQGWNSMGNSKNNFYEKTCVF